METDGRPPSCMIDHSFEDIVFPSALMKCSSEWANNSMINLFFKTIISEKQRTTCQSSFKTVAFLPKYNPTPQNSESDITLFITIYDAS